MKFLTGVKKELLLLKMLKDEPRMRKMPKGFLLYLRNALKYEKFVEHEGVIVLNSQMPPYPGPAFDNFLRVGEMAIDGRPAPASCHIAVTNRCEYDCWHCSNYHRKDPGRDLAKELLLDTIHRMQDMGNSLIGITGGEPLLREDLVELVEGIGPRSSVMLFTTGHKLTQEKANALKAAGLFSMVISLDHYRAKEHDEVRGFKGAYDIAMKAIEYSKRAGLYTIVSTVPKNEFVDNGDVQKFMDFVRDIGGVHEIRFLAPIPSGRIVGQRKLRWSKKQKEIMWELHRKGNRGKDYPRISVYSMIESGDVLGCTAGFYHLFIEGDGQVTPCDMIPLSFGNIKDEPFEAIFEKMTSAYKKPRNGCFLRAAVGLLGKEFEKSGQLPVPYEKTMEIVNKIPNKETSQFYKKLGMPQAQVDEWVSREEALKILGLEDK